MMKGRVQRTEREQAVKSESSGSSALRNVIGGEAAKVELRPIGLVLILDYWNEVVAIRCIPFFSAASADWDCVSKGVMWIAGAPVLLVRRVWTLWI